MARGRKPKDPEEVVKFTKLIVTLNEEADADIKTFLDSLPPREKSQWIRDAIRNEMAGRKLITSRRKRNYRKKVEEVVEEPKVITPENDELNKLLDDFDFDI